MKRTLELITSLLIGIFVGIAIHGSYQSHDYTIEKPEPKTEYIYIESEPEVKYVFIPFEQMNFRNYTEQEEWYFKDLGMREAEGEGVIGMLWVMYCAECRCKAFGTTIEQEWAGSAFKTSMFRSGIEPNEDCLKAYELFREGWEPKPLYFRAGGYHSFGTELCQVGNHYFSTR